MGAWVLRSRPTNLALYTSSANKTPVGNSWRRGLRLTASIASRDAYTSLDNPSERSTTAYFHQAGPVVLGKWNDGRGLGRRLHDQNRLPPPLECDAARAG